MEVVTYGRTFWFKLKLLESSFQSVCKGDISQFKHPPTKVGIDGVGGWGFLRGVVKIERRVVFFKY